MGKAKVNTDMFSYTVPATIAGQPPEPRTAYRGEVIELDADQEKRGRDLLINADYPAAPGSAETVRAQEPALVDADYDSEVAGAKAARAARAAALRAELAALEPDEAPKAAGRRSAGQ